MLMFTTDGHVYMCATWVGGFSALCPGISKGLAYMLVLIPSLYPIRSHKTKA